jgi:hypothetical protein
MSNIALAASMRMSLARYVDFAAACLAALTTISQTQGTQHERLLRLSLVWWRRAAEDPRRGSPLLFRHTPTPLTRDLPQARGVRPERLAKFRARFLERGRRVGTGILPPRLRACP